MVFEGQFATPRYGGCNHEEWFETVVKNKLEMY